MHPDLSFAQYHIAGLDFNLKKAPPSPAGQRTDGWKGKQQLLGNCWETREKLPRREQMNSVTLLLKFTKSPTFDIIL